MDNLTNGRVSSAVLLDHNGREIRPSHESEDRSDGLDLPHIITFASLYRGAAFTYNHLWDEALKHSRQNAMAMRRDAWLMALLRERADETLSKPWHLEVDNPRDKWQRTVCQGMTKIVEGIHRLKRMQRYLLQGALWYGRYGSNVKWAWREMYLPIMSTKGGGTNNPTSAPTMARGKVLTIVKHKPVNGDKIGHHQDDTPYVLVNSSWTEKIIGERQVIYPNNAQGPALLLRGTWRDQIIIHSADPDDGDYFDAEMAEGVHGVGIRSRIYWLDFLRRDYFGAVTEMLNRIGLGLVVIYYDSSNTAAKDEAEKMAKNYSRRSVIVMPRTNDGVSQGGGIEVVETPMAGAQVMLDLQKHVEDQIERYMVFQGISAGGGSSNPLEGTGRSEFAKDTKVKGCMADAFDHDATWTGSDDDPGPVSIIKKWTYSYADFPVRYVTEQEEKQAPKDRMESITTFVDMGGEVATEEVREIVGVREIEEGEETLGGKEEMLALQQMEHDEQMANLGNEHGDDGPGTSPGDDTNGESPTPAQKAETEGYAAHDVSGQSRGQPDNSGKFGPGGGPANGGSKGNGKGAGNKKRAIAHAKVKGKGLIKDFGKPVGGEEVGGEGEQAETPEAAAKAAQEAIYTDPTKPPGTDHLKFLQANTGPNAPSADPLNLVNRKFPPELEEAVINAFQELKAGNNNPYLSQTTHQVIAAVQKVMPGANVQDIQAVLVKLHRGKQLEMTPYTEALATIPENERQSVIPLDRDPKYYLKQGEMPFKPKEDQMETVKDQDIGIIDPEFDVQKIRQKYGDELGNSAAKLQVVYDKLQKINQVKGPKPTAEMRKEKELRDEYRDLRNSIKEGQEMADDNAYEAETARKAARRKELGMKYRMDGPVVTYVAGEVSVHELLDRIRKLGPYMGKELINGLLDTLKRQPQLRRQLSTRDLALIQALSMSVQEDYAAIFEAMV